MYWQGEMLTGNDIVFVYLKLIGWETVVSITQSCCETDIITQMLHLFISLIYYLKTNI